MSLNKILKQQLENIKPEKEVLDKIKNTAKEFCKELEKKLRRKRIKAGVFVGGSLVKGTLIKKDKYDVDIFVRFNKKYKDEDISELLGKVLGRAKKIHGSRDYFQVLKEGVVFEIIPVVKINRPEEARNITDLSYFHVSYIVDKLKKKKLREEIMLAKSFCYAQNCYGAESYIRGFSGYALELLICHYKSFLRFIKEISRRKDKIIIDDAKFYKSKQEILRELNESKIQSPIILIDPTFKDRNALAGLSEEVFKRFQKVCKDFLKKGSLDFFIKQDINKELSKKYPELNAVIVKTNKPPGDVSGAKAKKFFEFFVYSLKKEFKIKKSFFEYDSNKNTANFYFVLGKKEDEIKKGPEITDIENLRKFKRAHSNAFIKNHRAYARIKHNLSFEKFMKDFLKNNKKIIKEMDIEKIKLMKQGQLP